MRGPQPPSAHCDRLLTRSLAARGVTAAEAAAVAGGAAADAQTGQQRGQNEPR